MFSGLNNQKAAGKRAILSSSSVLLCAVLISGCGNQMFRQASYGPLDTPRAAPPSESVPVDPSRAPSDSRAVVSPAWGDNQAALVAPLPASFPGREPVLPPPNLSDNARNMPAPATVDAIHSPYPLSDTRFIIAGHTMFLNRCVQCHNATGYGYGVVGTYLLPHPPDLASNLVQHISDGAVFWHITMGQGKMPGFRHWTTPTERWALVSYVRSLRGAAPNGPGLIDPHVSDTRGTPYPVYGEVGYEDGKNESAWKALGQTPVPADSRTYGDKTGTQEDDDQYSH